MSEEPKFKPPKPPANVLIDTGLFVAQAPEYKNLPEEEIRIIVAHCMGMSVQYISEQMNKRKEYIQSVIDKHDPDRSLALREPVKLAIAKVQLTNIAAIIAASFQDINVILSMSVKERLEILDLVVRIVKNMKVEVTSAGRDTRGALGRLAGAVNKSDNAA